MGRALGTPPPTLTTGPRVVVTFSLPSSTLSQTLVQTIARGVLEVIVDQSPFGPEETLEEQKTQVGETAFSEEEKPENEAAWRKPVSKKQPGERIPHSQFRQSSQRNNFFFF